MDYKLIPVFLAFGLLLAGCTNPLTPAAQPPAIQPMDACCGVQYPYLVCFDTPACRAGNYTTLPAGIIGVVFNQTKNYTMPEPGVNISNSTACVNAPVCTGTGANTTCTGNCSPMNCSLVNNSQVCNPL